MLKFTFWNRKGAEDAKKDKNFALFASLNYRFAASLRSAKDRPRGGVREAGHRPRGGASPPFASIRFARDCFEIASCLATQRRLRFFRFPFSVFNFEARD